MNVTELIEWLNTFQPTDRVQFFGEQTDRNTEDIDQSTANVWLSIVRHNVIEGYTQL